MWFVSALDAARWPAALSGPADTVIADLEDGVPADRKAEARAAVADSMRARPPRRAEAGVRVNALGTDLARLDVEAVSGLPLDLLAVPKAESADAVRRLAEGLERAGSPARLLLVVETARGVLRADELADCSPRIAAMAFGAEDYAADVGATRTAGGEEVLWARSRVVAAAAAAKVDAIDQIHLPPGDLEGLATETRFAARLGFTGKLVVSGDQAEAVHRALAPTPAEVEWARGVLERARAAGGAVLIDRPVAAQAERILRRAGGG
ncbi:MAG TPA: CoA ester lyase [Candidatus Thermoplasmatota archaeon]